MKSRAAAAIDTSFSTSFPVVRVIWLDHAIVTQESFSSIPKILRKAEEPMTMATIGYLLEETDDYVLVAQTITVDGDCSEIMKILKPTIVKGPTKICPATTTDE